MFRPGRHRATDLAGDSTTRQQTRRWLERHNARELSVIADRGKRVKIARGLELDWFVRRHARTVLRGTAGDLSGRHLDRRNTEPRETRADRKQAV